MIIQAREKQTVLPSFQAYMIIDQHDDPTDIQTFGHVVSVMITQHAKYRGTLDQALR
jgi:hypothetical protein